MNAITVEDELPEGLTQAESDELLDWLEDKATPERSAEFARRIQFDAAYCERAKPVFIIHELNVWLRTEHGLVARDFVSGWAGVRARSFVKLPIAGLTLPRLDLDRARDRTGYPDDAVVKPAPGRYLEPRATEEQRHRQAAMMTDSAAWLTALAPAPFTGRVPHLPRRREAHVAVLFPLLIQMTAKGAPPKSFLERTEIAQDTGLARAFIWRVRIARKQEGLGDTARRQILADLISVMTDAETTRDPEYLRLDAELDKASLADAENSPDDLTMSPERAAVLSSRGDRWEQLFERELEWVNAELRREPL